MVRGRGRVRCFIVTGGHKWVLYGSIAEGVGRGSASGLWLGGRLCSMLIVMLGGDLDLATWAQTWIHRPRPTSVRILLSDGDIVLKHLFMSE